MSQRHKFGFGLITHILVAVLFLLIGVRLGTNLTFRQLFGLIQGANGSQIVRLQNTEPPAQVSEVDFSQFWDVWLRLERDYVDPSKLDAQQLVYGAIKGMTEAVGDPYTVFLEPETKQRLTEDLQGEFNGVGIELGYIDEQLAIIAPLKNLPAEKAGAKAGDYILRIKDSTNNVDKDTIGITSEEAVDLIRGKRGTKVTLTLLTKGEQPRDVEMTREPVTVPSLEVKYVDHNGKKYAHFILSRFGDKTVAEWDAAVEDALKQNVQGVVLDMRNNPGGYLQDSIDLASDFFDGGIVVSQQGRVTNESYRPTRSARLNNTPVVILVNKGSASASEILAGALRDRRGAKLVGTQTFGKGTVQDAQILADGSGLNVTIARWLLPSGQSIQDSGLPVDVEVEDNAETPEDEALNRALETL